MKLVTSEEMQNIDKASARQFGIPSILLMENAGNASYQYIRENVEDYRNRKFLVFCGAGNNGGDGAVLARKLFLDGVYVRVIFVADLAKAAGDAKANFDILMAIGVPFDVVLSQENWDAIKQSLFHYHIVIDAIFGIGFRGDMSGFVLSIVQYINNVVRMKSDGAPRIVSLDIPSGVYGNGGIANAAVRADVTLTMALPKLGMIDYPAKEWVGKVAVMDINVPRDLLKDWSLRHNLLTEDHVKRIYVPRIRNSHKGIYGHLLIVGGKLGMSGAVVMAAGAALRSGVGLATVAVPQDICPVVAQSLPEAMTIPMNMSDPSAAYRSIADYVEARSIRTILIGNGFGTGEVQEKLFGMIAEAPFTVPMVIDADGLNILARRPDLVKTLAGTGRKVIVTPHIGEMARLVDRDVAFVKQFKVDAARDYAVKNKFIVVLKDVVTAVAFPDGQVWLSDFGSPALAKGGSGDVLAGIVAGMATTGEVPETAPLVAVYALGKIGEFYEKNHSAQSMLASDIVSMIPDVFHYIENLE